MMEHTHGQPQDQRPSGAAAASVKAPACGMSVRGDSPHRVTHAGIEYRFCSEGYRATPMAQLALERRYVKARALYNKTGRCLYCDLIDVEREPAHRIVHETSRFVVFCPFASGVPFETWIAPKRHQPSFRAISVPERIELVASLRATLGALDEVFGRPDFNYVLQTALIADEDKPYYLWHLQVLPRIATLVCFELGSGIPTNTAFPEDAAASLRQARVSWVQS